MDLGEHNDCGRGVKFTLSVYVIKLPADRVSASLLVERFSKLVHVCIFSHVCLFERFDNEWSHGKKIFSVVIEESCVEVTCQANSSYTLITLSQTVDFFSLTQTFVDALYVLASETPFQITNHAHSK